MADSGIVDRNGRRLATAPYSLYRTPSQRPGAIRPVRQPRAKTYEAVNAWQRRELVDVSRVIAAGVPNISTALTQAGEFSVGDSWHMKSQSKNKAWGKKRDEWFNTVYARDCNMRGRQSDWLSSLRQLNWSRKVQGDYGIVFDGTPSNDPLTGKQIDPTGRFQVIKYDRISTGLIGGWQGVGVVSVGNGLDQCKELPRTWNYYSGASGWSSWPGIYIINDNRSRFDGQRIIDGVIVDGNMVVLGYRIVGFNDEGLPVYCDVPKAQIHFNFSTRQDTDLIRGIPELAEAIIPIMHLDDIQDLISMAMKLASALAVTRESVDGNPNRSNRHVMDEEWGQQPPNCAPGEWQEGTPSWGVKSETRAVEEIYPGIYELATSNKEALKTLEFDRPSMNEENFIARIETSVLHKIWPRGLVYIADAARAGARSLAIQANTICTWDQKCIERDARFIGDRHTEFSMRMGYIPYNDDLADPYQYGFTVPAKFTVDEGNDAKMRLSALGRCVISRGQICELDGYLAEEIEEQRYNEIDRILTASENLADKHKDFSVKEIALMFDSGESIVSFSDNAMQDEDGVNPTNGTTPPGTQKPKKQETNK